MHTHPPPPGWDVPPEPGQTWSTMAGTEKIMASLNTGLVSSLFTAVFFLLIFLPSCSRYTLTKGSAQGRGREKPQDQSRGENEGTHLWWTLLVGSLLNGSLSNKSRVA